MTGRSRAARGLPATLCALAMGAGGVHGAAGQEAAPGAGPDPLLEAGVSRALAEHRSATLSDVVYEVSLRVPAERTRPVTGRVTIRFTKSDGGPLILDFADPGRVHEVRVDGRPVEYEAVNTHVVVPRHLLPAGRGAVTLRFTAGDGPLNRRDEFLYTLFVPDRAHEALPSFDQPDIRARFRLELTVPAGWEAVANGAETARESTEAGTTHRFAPTEPLPTYLFAFAAGRFQVEEAERDGRRLRLLHRETDAEKVARNRDALFDLHATALAWLEAYTGIAYPFGKFDFVAIPSFQYNGMEHPGSILYRASSLFLDESATRNEELGRASVIAHETAHMWFGDLVTMRWFDDVWMKEVFANFMAAKIVNPSFPELDHELRFLLAHYPAAYAVDRTAGANPIRQPLDNLSEAGSLYGAIIYQKAPIVMRQLERLTGEGAFREALRRYLRTHAMSNAGWPDLVRVLDEIAPLDVAAWSRTWIEEPGRPRIAVEPLPAGAGFRATQEDPQGRGRVWDQVLDIGWVRSDSVVPGPPVRLAGRRADVPADPAADALLPNAGGVAYGLLLPDSASRALLARALPRIRPALARAAAWLDLRELMLEGGVAPVAMLDLAAELVAGEADELLAQQVLADLVDLFWRYVPPDAREERAGRLESLLWTRMLEVGASSEKAAYFNAWRAIATSPEAVERMRTIWDGDLEVEGLPLSERDRTTLALHLAVRGVPEAESILDRQAAAIDNPDRRERFEFIRPAVSADAVVRDSFFHALGRAENRAREEWVVTALSYLHHPLRAPASVHHLRPALELLPEIRATGDIFFPTRWLDAILSGHASEEAAAVVRDFVAETPELPPRLVGKLLQEADPLFRAARLRRSAR